MGFEVKYKYYEKVDGDYDKDNVHELNKKVGKAYDDTSYEKLASAIMGQFARRDIMVVDVEITEFVKKKISFREATNGIVIKNKKYLFDGTEIEFQAVEEDQEEVQEVAASVSRRVVQPTKNGTSLNGLKEKPIRYEFFEPPKELLEDFKKRNFKFTVGKKYPIFEEKSDRRGIQFGMLYTTQDDEGKKQILNDKLFVYRGGLFGGSQFNDSRSVDLNYGNVIEEEVPKLR